MLVPPNIDKRFFGSLDGRKQLLPSFPLVREDAAGNLFHLELPGGGMDVCIERA